MTEVDSSPFAERARTIAELLAATERDARETQTRLTELRQQVNRLREERAQIVAEMRASGDTWNVIGERLGITRQAALHIGKNTNAA